MAMQPTKWANLPLRLVGAVTLVVSAALWSLLFRTPTRSPDAIAFLLALLAFASLSAGSAMLVLGQHLFDQVELSQRWTRRY
ncbi:hypothetical protein [Sphingomonas sp. MMS24-J13]|uniref:hypothetical protein n=1 Tax=Sphingomonas sp. MMS24-J13 TaxID=3238686 RepID=UPI00384CA8B8